MHLGYQIKKRISEGHRKYLSPVIQRRTFIISIWKRRWWPFNLNIRLEAGGGGGKHPFWELFLFFVFCFCFFFFWHATPSKALVLSLWVTTPLGGGVTYNVSTLWLIIVEKYSYEVAAKYFYGWRVTTTWGTVFKVCSVRKVENHCSKDVFHLNKEKKPSKQKENNRGKNPQTLGLMYFIVWCKMLS